MVISVPFTEMEMRIHFDLEFPIAPWAKFFCQRKTSEIQIAEV
jgi:hypothetical protein